MPDIGSALPDSGWYTAGQITGTALGVGAIIALGVISGGAGLGGLVA